MRRAWAWLVAALVATSACGRAAAPSDAEAATAAAASAGPALHMPSDARYVYLGQTLGAQAGTELAFVEADGAGRYAVVRVSRPSGGGAWRLVTSGPVWDQPVATGEVHAAAELAPGDWQTAPRTAAQREGMAFGLPMGAAWGQAVDDGAGATVLATVSPSQGSYLVRLQQAGGTWTIADIEPRGGVARRSSSFDIATPGLGAGVGSPLRVTGRARVFEAAFFVELQDGSGHVLVHRDAMAQTDESGWGTFDLSLAYTGASGPGRLVFGYISPKDGSRVEDVVVPVTLGGQV